MPTAKVLDAKLAAPALKVTGLPVATPSTLNCTVPVGKSVPELGATVAVNVTDSINAEGLAELDIKVAVPTTFTTWLSTADVAGL